MILRGGKISNSDNIDLDTVTDFGREWSRFTQSELDPKDRARIFTDYFAIFPWEYLPPDGGEGADIGCGSGRWAQLVAPRVSHLHLVDASKEAVAVAKSNLATNNNVSFHQASVDELPFPDESLDFVYSLGVLHHVPDTQSAICAIARKLKPGAPFLLYLYYAFDNRPFWYRSIWKLSDYLRRILLYLPWKVRYAISQLIALLVYWPLARCAYFINRWGRLPDTFPLAYYRDKSFYVMRTDAVDRFATRLEQRYTRMEIESMLLASGFVNVCFSEQPPYWCAVGVKS